MTQFSLSCHNSSANTGSFVVYQMPFGGSPNTLPLAWFAHVAAPSTRVKFTWDTNYSFVWSETGVLAPGVEFYASQTRPADLTGLNQITFTDAGGGPTFSNPTAGHAPGSLTIVADSTVPLHAFSIGLGMGGHPVFAAQALPNWITSFTPRPQYFVAFGEFTQGEVLDAQAISNACPIDYPANVHSLAAILSADDTWSVGNLT